MNFSHAVVVGVPTSHAWSTTYTKEVSSGLIACVLCAHSQDTIAEAKHYLSSFIEAVTSYAQAFSHTEFLAALAKVPPTIDAAFIFIEGKTLFCSTQGSAGVWLERGQQQARISPQGPKGQVMQGTLGVGDVVMVATKSLMENFSHHWTYSMSPMVRSDTIATALSTADATGEVAGIFVGVVDGALLEAESGELPVGTVGTLTELSKVFPRDLSEDLPEDMPRMPQVNTQAVSKAYTTRYRPSKTFIHKLAKFTHSPQHRKMIVAIGLGILLICGVIGVSTIVEGRKKHSADLVYAQITAQFAAMSEEGKNNRIEGLNKLTSYEDELNRRIQAERRNRYLATRLQELLTEVGKKKIELSGEQALARLTPYYDFRLIASDFIASSIAPYLGEDQLVFMDALHSRLLTLSTKQKQAKVFSFDERMQDPLAMAVGDSDVYILGTEGIAQIPLTLDKLGRILVERKDTWQTPQAVSVFGTNLYVLDKGQRGIFRYDLENTSVDPVAWFRSKEGIDFESISSFVVDGDVWLGTHDGKILRFSRGEPASFVIKDLTQAFDSTIVLAAYPESESLYVLEPRAKRLLVIGKDGTYKKAIVSEELSTATALVVDESTGTAYVTAGSLVYEVKL